MIFNGVDFGRLKAQIFLGILRKNEEKHLKNMRRLLKNVFLVLNAVFSNHKTTMSCSPKSIVLPMSFINNKCLLKTANAIFTHSCMRSTKFIHFTIISVHFLPSLSIFEDLGYRKFVFCWSAFVGVVYRSCRTFS